MASARRSCRNDLDVVCYICRDYTLPVDRRNITGFVKHAHKAYFEVKLGDQDKSWVPRTVCKTCLEYLWQWTKGVKTSLKVGISIVRREPLDYASDYYFCAIDTTSISRKSQHSLQYTDLLDDWATGAYEGGYTEEEYKAKDGLLLSPQCELNALVRDLSLSKTFPELLASRLKVKNPLDMEKFPGNLGAMSHELGKRSHQDMRKMKDR
ncbi:hypothetical protein QYM36_013126 [Artemia franciscana]|uniref:Uncharacterized protein n=1 Tax=Artemia franciscana TaxID=6661 RepID=A0AA88HPE6_ARTSF|nr:hypothetical protein QYM36_013126 [Artemia franciscana]